MGEQPCLYPHSPSTLTHCSPPSGSWAAHARPKQVFQAIARDLAVSSDLLEERLGSGASRFENQIAWARWYLVATGFIDGSHRGVWKLTDKAWTAGFLSEHVLREIVAETQSKGKVPSAEDEAEVPETSAEELDIEKLQALYNSDSVSQWFLEHVASRQRNQSETSVERACRSSRAMVTMLAANKSSPSSSLWRIVTAANSLKADADGHHVLSGPQQ